MPGIHGGPGGRTPVGAQAVWVLNKSIILPQPPQVSSTVCHLWLEPSGTNIKMILLFQHYLVEVEHKSHM